MDPGPSSQKAGCQETRAGSARYTPVLEGLVPNTTYKRCEGWTIEDLHIAYEMIENPVKAEISLALMRQEDQQLWLRRKLTGSQSTV